MESGMTAHDAVPVRVDELRQLITERADLITALEEFTAAFHNCDETTSLHIWNDRMKLADAHAVLILGRIAKAEVEAYANDNEFLFPDKP